MTQQIDHTYRNGIMNALRDSARDGRVGDVTNILDQHEWLLGHPGALSDGMIDAAYKGNNDVLQVFLDRGVDVDAPNDTGNSVLHAAASQGQLGTVDFLLEHGADINFQDNQGNTALYFAALAGNDVVAEKLIDKGADAGLRGRDGRTPAEAARYQHHHGFADRLLAYIAHRNARKAKYAFAGRTLAGRRGGLKP